jgi:hypothetical protein
MSLKLSVLKVICFVLLTGCSVYKAAENKGVDIYDIEKCSTRSCLLSKGLKVISSKNLSTGLFQETYQGLARKSGVNYLRAGGHAVLDVCTLGLWEIVGTPVEGAISNNRGYWIVKAEYEDESAEIIKTFNIYAPNGKQAKRKGIQNK